MYTRFFGLKREPFSIAPDPRYLFMSERHREALAHLLYGVRGGGGVVLLTGQIGAGKTTVCRAFFEQLPSQVHVAYVVNPKLSALELLQTVCDEFHVAYRPEPTDQHERPYRPRSVKDFIDPLNAFLLQAHAAGENCLLVIDEAQQLSSKVLEQLRLLTNLETNERKLLQIVLIGQPELRTLLAQPELEQLAQRVIARYHLEALDEADTTRYVRHRLGVAGLAGTLPFDAGALRALHKLSGGIPRRINLLADRALLGAYSGDASRVTAATVRRAAAEVMGEEALPPRTPWRPLAGAALGLALLAGAAWAWQAQPWRAPAAPAAAVSASAPASAPPRPTASAPKPRPVAPPATLAYAPFANEKDAWRALAPVWGWAPAAERPVCDQAGDHQTRCWRQRLTLADLRRLDRPGLLTLQAADAPPSAALLVALRPDAAVLRGAQGEQVLPLPELAAQWRGDFATLWRTPEGYRGRLGEQAPAPQAQWLTRQLAIAQIGVPLPAAASLRQRIAAFQTAEGLPADGMAGPRTLMHLNRATGVDEPRLSTPERR
ncbi:MAG: peptidoglycan-binding protein [Pseudomonadota bacterium]